MPVLADCVAQENSRTARSSSARLLRHSGDIGDNYVRSLIAVGAGASGASCASGRLPLVAAFAGDVFLPGAFVLSWSDPLGRGSCLD